MRTTTTPGVLLLVAGSAMGQWSDDPSTNLLVSGTGSSPAVTHSAPDGNGGCWVTWYDASAGYDVLLQHVDASGEVLFADPVVLDDQSNSWVQDFELAVDSLGRAVVAWPGSTMVEAVCVDFDGSVVWQNEHGQPGAFHAQVQLAALPGGSIALAWLQDNSSVLQRVNLMGVPEGDPVTINIGGTLAPSDLRDSGGGSFIASFVHYTTFSGPKRLKAQKFDVDMNTQWGLAPINVFSSGSLQYGNYPEFIADTTGGAVLCWYETSPLMARLQWIDSDGNRLMGTNGMTTTTETSMVHVNPHACIDPVSGDATVFWVRQNSSQGSSGIQANRITPAGTRLWGATGIQLLPVSSGTTLLDLHAMQVGSLATGSWIKSPTLGSEQVQAAAVHEDGSLAWGFAPVLASNAPSDKTDMTSCPGDGMLITCWVDDRNGTDQLFAQNVNEDGTLGSTTCAGDIDGNDAVDVTDLLAVISEWGQCPIGGDCPADTDGNGSVDVGDLLMVIANWGSCP